MKTKREFDQAAAAAISDYPTIAALYRARDPSLMAMLGAMSTMLAMASAEQDVAASEPFTKARDATVLADAAAKGVLPFGIASVVKIEAKNTGSTAYTIQTGRRLMDSQGRPYVVQAGVSVPAGGTASLTAVQESERRFDHTVTITQPFYQIEVPAAAEGRAITGVRVIAAWDNGEFRRSERYVNVLPGDRVFHLQSDERRRLLVEFGADGLAGYAPAAGEVFTVVVTDTDGDVSLAAGSKFAFEYTASAADASVTLTLDQILTAGRGAIDIPTLRAITNCPSIYDTSAVYLGNFDFLVRRSLSPFRFLSIWNEQVEEAVRGANVDNINTLFVSAKKDGSDDVAVFDAIKALIVAADDSLRVKRVPVVEVEVPVHVHAYVHSVYDFQQVEQQIREQVLANYGRDSAFAQQGQAKILYRRVYQLLTDTVPALQGERADLDVEVTNPAGQIPPETYRYVSDASLTVTVEQVA